MHRHAVKCGNTATVPPAARPRKLHIPRPAASGRSRPFRCSSSPKCKRWRWFAFWFCRGASCLSMTASTRIERCGQHTPVTSPHRTTRRLYRTVLSMIVVATQEYRRIDCHDKHNAPAYSPGNFRQIRRCVLIFTRLNSVIQRMTLLLCFSFMTINRLIRQRQWAQRSQPGGYQHPARRAFR